MARRALWVSLLFWLLFWMVGTAVAQDGEGGADYEDDEAGERADVDDADGSEDSDPSEEASDSGGDPADRVAGDFGVGGEGTLGGTTGVQARLMLGPTVGVQLTLGVAILTANPEGSMASRTETGFGVGLSLQFRIFGWADGYAAILAGLDFQTANSDDAGVTSSATLYAGTFGLWGEMFLEPYLSLHAQTGVRVGFRGGDGDGMFVSAAGDLFTGFGFTFWI